MVVVVVVVLLPLLIKMKMAFVGGMIVVLNHGFFDVPYRYGGCVLQSLLEGQLYCCDNESLSGSQCWGLSHSDWSTGGIDVA